MRSSVMIFVNRLEIKNFLLNAQIKKDFSMLCGIKWRKFVNRNREWKYLYHGFASVWNDWFSYLSWCCNAEVSAYYIFHFTIHCVRIVQKGFWFHISIVLQKISKWIQELLNVLVNSQTVQSIFLLVTHVDCLCCGIVKHCLLIK